MRRPHVLGLLVIGSLALVLAGWGNPASRSSTASPLTVVAAPTPRFPVPRYDTTGTFPQVRGGGSLDAKAVNDGLREGVLADQRAYARRVRKAALTGGRNCRGIYRTSTDRTLLSASTVVVSAMLPALKLLCGTLGQTWVSVTVRVPSGAPVHLTDLFANAAVALPVLAEAWKARVRHAEPVMWPCVKNYPSLYVPSARNYQYFALTPRGLSLGFLDVPACPRLQAVVPYSILHPYLSKLGTTLIAGVRRAQ